MNILLNIVQIFPRSHQLGSDGEVRAPHGLRERPRGRRLLTNNFQEMKKSKILSTHIKQLRGLGMKNISSRFKPSHESQRVFTEVLKYWSQMCHTWISSSFNVEALSKQTSQTLLALLYFTLIQSDSSPSYFFSAVNRRILLGVKLHTRREPGKSRWHFELRLYSVPK